MNDKSQTSTNNPNSSTSSPTVTSSQTKNIESSSLDEDFLTAPLIGLCPKPVHEMTQQEREAHVMVIRQLRQSFQTFKSEVELKEAENLKVKKATPRKISSVDIDALLE